MSSLRDPDLLIKAYLAEGINELPERSYDAVRVSIDHVRQWTTVGRWTEPQLLKGARLMVIAAAVAVLAVIAIRALPAQVVAPGGTPSLEAAVPIPDTQYIVVLTPGRYSEPNSITRLPVTFTVPAIGWQSLDGLIQKGNLDGDWANRAYFGSWLVDSVYADSCKWVNTMQPVTTAAEIVDALATQLGGHIVSAPKSVEIGGVPATLIEMSVPADFDVNSCSGAEVREFPGLYRDETRGLVSLPGQTDDIYVVDSSSGPFVISASVMPNASQEDKDELDALVNSIHIGSN